MSKIKTRKSLVKRFKITKTGKVMRKTGFSSHLNVKRSSKKRRRHARPVEVTGFYAKKVKKALGVKTRSRKEKQTHA